MLKEVEIPTKEWSWPSIVPPASDTLPYDDTEDRLAMYMVAYIVGKEVGPTEGLTHPAYILKRIHYEDEREAMVEAQRNVSSGIQDMIEGPGGWHLVWNAVTKQAMPVQRHQILQLWPVFREKTLFARRLYRKMGHGDHFVNGFTKYVHMYLSSHAILPVMKPKENEMLVRIDTHIPSNVVITTHTQHHRISHRQLETTGVFSIARAFAKHHNIRFVITAQATREDMMSKYVHIPLSWLYTNIHGLPSDAAIPDSAWEEEEEEEEMVASPSPSSVERVRSLPESGGASLAKFL